MVFILSALWRIRVRGLWKLSYGRLTCSDGWGNALEIFNPIFCWWAGLCSLPVIWPKEVGVGVIMVMVTSFKRTCALHCWIQCPQTCREILKEMGIPEHLTCLLRNLYAGQEATVRTAHGTTDWFPVGKGVCQGCILSPCLFNLYAEYVIETLGWKKNKLESRLPGEISITSDMQMTPPLWQKVKRN